MQLHFLAPQPRESPSYTVIVYSDSLPNGEQIMRALCVELDLLGEGKDIQQATDDLQYEVREYLLTASREETEMRLRRSAHIKNGEDALKLSPIVLRMRQPEKPLSPELNDFVATLTNQAPHLEVQFTIPFEAQNP